MPGTYRLMGAHILHGGQTSSAFSRNFEWRSRNCFVLLSSLTECLTLVFRVERQDTISHSEGNFAQGIR